MQKKEKQTSKKLHPKPKQHIIFSSSSLTIGLMSVLLFGILLTVTQGDTNQQYAQANQHQKDEQTSPIVITAKDLDTTSSDPTIVANDGLDKWFMYNDSTDTVDNTLGSFVLGPDTPMEGLGSIEFTLGADPLDRKNIATYQFSGTPLASISEMSFHIYSHSGVGGSSEAPFLLFNVDFTGSSSDWQRRLVFVPSVNGSVTQDTWQTWNAIDAGNGQWTWSGFGANGNKWPDNNTNQYRSWSELMTAFPHARILPVGGLLGIRVGEPGPAHYVANIDLFSITKNGLTTVYDFDPVNEEKKACKNNGWKNFSDPSFKNQGECINYMLHKERTGRGGHRENQIN